MRAKVTTAFKGLKDETTAEPVDIAAGEELGDSFAWQAVQAGYAEWLPGQQPTAAEDDVLRHAPAPKFPLERRADDMAAATTIPRDESKTTSTDAKAKAKG